MAPEADFAGTAPVAIEVDGLFRPRSTYELIYTAARRPIVGLGPAAVRDSLSFFRYEAAGGFGRPNTLLAVASGCIRGAGLDRTYYTNAEFRPSGRQLMLVCSDRETITY